MADVLRGYAAPGRARLDGTRIGVWSCYTHMTKHAIGNSVKRSHGSFYGFCMAAYGFFYGNVWLLLWQLLGRRWLLLVKGAIIEATTVAMAAFMASFMAAFGIKEDMP